MKRRAHTGFTLTELAIVLAVIGTIVGAIWGVASDVIMNKNVAVANKQLTTIVGNIRTIYAEQGGISNGGDTTPVTITKALDQLRAFPLDMRANAAGAYGTLFHSWNVTPAAGFGLGNVLVTAVNCTAGTGAPTSVNSIETCFGVYYYNLTQNACVQFLTNGITTATGLESVFVNGNNVTFPTDIGTANTACTSATTNSIEWVYLLKDNAL